MKVNYPNGQNFPGRSQQFKNMNKGKTKISYGNRGMTLEKDLDLTNEQYLSRNQAVIYKKPTPIQVVTVDYPKREAAKITEAYYKRASTTDYNGVYRGYYLDFEAKETKNKTSFPLKNFHDHQLEHMKSCLNHGGICFVIVRFAEKNETYLYDAARLINWWTQSLDGGRQSLPYKEFKENGHFIPHEYSPRLPYLQAVDQLILKYEKNRNNEVD